MSRQHTRRDSSASRSERVHAFVALVALAALAPAGSATVTLARDGVPDAGAQRVTLFGFTEVGPFSGSSRGDDAAIYEARVEGIGTVYAPVPADCTVPELVVRADRRDDARMVAYVNLCENEAEAPLAADEPGLRGELQRVSQDDSGLVVDRVRRPWVHAIYGYTALGDARGGWVRLVPDRVEYISYDQQIREKPVWFVDPPSIEVFDRPNGTRLSLALPAEPAAADASEDPYGLEVLDIRGDWIRVHVTVPDGSSRSRNPGVKVERSLRAWVRRYDSRGRYQIAYGAAGC